MGLITAPQPSRYLLYRALGTLVPSIVGTWRFRELYTQKSHAHDSHRKCERSKGGLKRHERPGLGRRVTEKALRV